MTTPAKIFDNYDEFESADRGAIYCKNFNSDEEIECMYNKCIGCGQTLHLAIGGSDHPRWVIEQKNPITLSPSIHHPGCWHGYLRNGVWEEC